MWLSLRHPDGTRAAAGTAMEAEQVLPAIKALLANDPFASRFAPGAVLSAYEGAMPGASAVDCFHEIYSDFVFRAPTAAWAAAQTARGVPAYLYEFAHPSPIAGLGSPHTLEIPFVFGTYDSPFMAPKAEAGRRKRSCRG